MSLSYIWRDRPTKPKSPSTVLTAHNSTGNRTFMRNTIQETKIDSSIATSELFPETCPYSVYRKDRNIHGGGVMLLVHKDISHMPITELENDSESIWVKVFANKTSHFVASWYRPPGSTSEEFHLFREQLDSIRTHHKGKKLPSVHVLGDFNFKDIDWPDSRRDTY